MTSDSSIVLYLFMNDAQPSPMPMCPMAATCRGMMQKPFSDIGLIIAGIVLVMLEVLVVIESRILTWVMAVAFVLLGGMVLVMAGVMRRFTRERTNHR
jgi:hypothetical protein